ncbi:MAG: GNAT family N-acetyltransferase [Actinobacteria bacterium]|nr:GNAT family N-acetyltransferase [Actinomycetota bacterium]
MLTGCAPGLWPPSKLRALLHLSSGPRLAEACPLGRSLHTQRIIDAAHPSYDHFLVWMFAVSPAHQRAGLGRRLMREALATADASEAPAYVWTGNPDNLPTTAHAASRSSARRGSPATFRLVHGTTATPSSSLIMAAGASRGRSG